MNESKKSKSFSLAPIEAKILVNRGSVHKIEADSGTILAKNAKSFCSQKSSRIIK